MGVDKLGVDEMGVDKMGSRRSGDKPVFQPRIFRLDRKEEKRNFCHL